MIANWGNIFLIYSDSESTITKPIVQFINDIDNASQLSQEKLSEIHLQFWEQLIQTDDISNSSYNLILKANSWHFDNLDIENLDEEKVQLLISNNVLDPTTEMFNKLKENFESLHITFIEYNKIEFLKKIQELGISGKDIARLMHSTIILNIEKTLILDKIEDDIIFSNTENLKLISQLIIEDTAINIKFSVYKRIILTTIISIPDRIKTFISRPNFINSELTKEFLKTLSLPYSDITIAGKRPLIDNYEYNVDLLYTLQLKGLISKFEKEKKGLRVYTYRK